MIIIDPVAMGDAACSRPSPKWVFDRTGTLVEVPVDTLGVTYDPADLSKAPYALIEPAANNSVRNNTMQGAVVGIFGAGGAVPTNWSVDKSSGQNLEVVALGQENGVDYIDVRFSATANDRGYFALYPERSDGANVPAGVDEKWCFSQFIKLVAGAVGAVRVTACVRALNASGAQINTAVTDVALPASLSRVVAEHSSTPAGTARLTAFFLLEASIGAAFDMTVRMGLPQIERDKISSPIKTSGAAVIRAADVIGPTAGLIYSNVPMTEPPYNAATTYAKDAAVYDPATKIVYWSMQASNLGKPLSDPAWWNKRTAINRWAMLDDRNDTQTEGNEDILIVLSARAITQGLYLGNLDASEIRVAMTDQKRGLVYSETRSQVVSRSMASFYRWAFKRIRRRSYFLTLKLPVYANALVTILISRPGGLAKCGMCMLGPATDVGLSHYGLSTELKDFSDTSFNPDGTSKTVVRGYAKRMSVDVEVDNQEIDDVEEELIAFRQKVVVYVGTVLFGSAMLVGKFSSLKKVIPGLRKSRLSLQVEGVVTK